MTKAISLSLVASSILGLASLPAVAGQCDVAGRPMSSGTIDSVLFSCKHNSKTATVGRSGVRQGLTLADLRTGAIGSGAFTVTGALDASGNVINSCTVQDFTFASGTPLEVECPNGVRWTGSILYPE